MPIKSVCQVLVVHNDRYADTLAQAFAPCSQPNDCIAPLPLHSLTHPYHCILHPSALITHALTTCHHQYGVCHTGCQATAAEVSHTFLFALSVCVPVLFARTAITSVQPTAVLVLAPQITNKVYGVVAPSSLQCLCSTGAMVICRDFVTQLCRWPQ